MTSFGVGSAPLPPGLASQAKAIWETYSRLNRTALEQTASVRVENRDTAEISPTARQKMTEKKDDSRDTYTPAKAEQNQEPSQQAKPSGESGTRKVSDQDSKESSNSSDGELTDNEKKEVAALKKTDEKVRAHEQAHVSAGGGLVRGGASFSYDVGPDGKQYAVAGEVSIDTSPVDGDPEATITKAGRVKKAALAPSDPSPQDRSVAAEADSMAMKARMELARMQYARNGQTGQVVNMGA